MKLKLILFDLTKKKVSSGTFSKIINLKQEFDKKNKFSLTITKIQLVDACVVDGEV